MPKYTALDHENVLTERLAKIDSEIRSLEIERDVIQRHIHQARLSNADLKDVKQRRSVNRAVIEKIIIDILKSYGVPMKTKHIEITLASKSPGIKAVTFRVYLNRMAMKGLIESPKHGYWKIVRETKARS